MSFKIYTLIIAEKPDAANRIAVALDQNCKPEHLSENGIPFFSVNNGEIIVASALGHLYSVAGVEKGSYPVFNYQWIPRYSAEKGAYRTKIWLTTISKLAMHAKAFVDACDFDVEGSIIGYNVLKYACGKEQIAKRMKFSTLTREELQAAYANLLPQLDFCQIEAGLARHEVDWLYGINLSRALTAVAKASSGQYTTLSTGRVQGPTLTFLETREKAICSFVPTPYWRINANIVANGVTLEAAFEKGIIENKQEAQKIRKVCSGVKEAEVTRTAFGEVKRNPPVPFDLGSLQSETYRLFKYTPIVTSNAAQRLYINGLISYPRTSSQKLPPTIDYKNVLRKLSGNPAYAQAATKILAKPTLNPFEGSKSDLAHPAIYPTGDRPKQLDSRERNIYDLIVKRFLAVFGEPAVKQTLKVMLNIAGNDFAAFGSRTVKEGWMEFYKPYMAQTDDVLPPLSEEQKVRVEKVRLRTEFSTPPERYNPRSLLQKMEKEELGTKATRAAIIQTLFERKYLQGNEKIAVTNLGFEVAEVLQRYCPTIASPDMTRKLEEEMNAIYMRQKTKQEIISQVTALIKEISSELKANQEAIGAILNQALKQQWLDKKTIGACPKCKNGRLVVLRSKRTGKRFVGCTNHFSSKCDAAYPLPQKGLVKSCGVCKTCGFPSVNITFAGKRSWHLCLNSECPSKRKGANSEL